MSINLRSKGAFLPLASLLSLLIVALTACGNSEPQIDTAPTPAPAFTLTITGAGGTTRVLQYLANNYSKQHNDITFEFLSGSGSSGGVKGVLAGKVDLGAMSRPPKLTFASA